MEAERVIAMRRGNELCLSVFCLPERVLAQDILLVKAARTASHNRGNG